MSSLKYYSNDVEDKINALNIKLTFLINYLFHILDTLGVKLREINILYNSAGAYQPRNK